MMMMMMIIIIIITKKIKPNTMHLLCILPHVINIYQQDFLLNPFFYAFFWA